MWQASQLGGPWDCFMGTGPWVLSHTGWHAEDSLVEGLFWLGVTDSRLLGY